MATAISNNLYPPIIATYMPAFVHDGICRVYFSLSSYNSRSDIKYIQYTLVSQNTNFNALDPSVAVTGIYTTDNIIYDENRREYYIDISAKDLTDKIFQINKFYKLQLRFVENHTSIPSDFMNLINQPNSNAMTILNQYEDYYSEWSTVCLLKGISQPVLAIRMFEDLDTDIDLISIPELVDIVGKLTFVDPAEKEYLDTYEIGFLDRNGEQVFSSGVQYTNQYNPNEINYILNYRLEDSVEYTLVVKYTTNNGYEGIFSSRFIIIESGIDPIDAKIYAESEEELGRIKISIVGNSTDKFMGNIAIRRASNLTNYTIWEDVHIEQLIVENTLNHIWYDYTAESGVWYKYCVQRINSFGNRGAIVETKTPIMIVYDDMYLVNQNLQLKLKFDPQVSSFKKVVMDTKTDTLGGKYPVIHRNGNVGYRQFPISGLITAFCDEEGIFLNRENILGAELLRYDKYNTDNKITPYKDFIYEREFREYIMDFLHEHNAKLFKSTTEGNILVKLMDINFTPNPTLGRMIYSFSATAYEIDEASVYNYDKYNIQPIGTWKNVVAYDYEKTGQLSGIFNPSDNIMETVIQNEYSSNVFGDYVLDLKYLTWLKLEFEGEPYLIGTNENGSLYKETATTPIPEKDKKNAVLGYLVRINGADIVVGKRGVYELLDSDTKITSLQFPAADTQVTINYIAAIQEQENIQKMAKRLYFYVKAGQIINTFKMNDLIMQQIYLKYWEEYSKYYQQLLSVDKLTIEAMPGSIVYIKDSFDDDYNKHIIGKTGSLDFYDDEAIITNFYFGGVQLNPTLDETRDEIEDDTFYETNIIITNFNDIKHPKKNYVYIMDNIRYIFYNGDWHVINDENIVQCPVNALVNYIYELVKGEYEEKNESQTLFLFNR